MINIDTFLRIGKTHQECEDYIISGHDPIDYIILSDGCSSSNQTEMGARILCHLAKQYLLYRKDDYRFPDLDYNEMGLWIIHNAELAARQLGLKSSCLNATLIVAYVAEGRVYIYIYGDGVIICKNKNDIISLSEVEFTQNAPYYLAYKINPEDMELFHKMGQDLVIKNISDLQEWEDTYAYDFKTRFIFKVDEISTILISSDGISSFVKNGEPIINFLIAEEFLAYKSTKGEFLKRRLKRALKNYIADNTFHNDDISVGAFLNEEK